MTKGKRAVSKTKESASGDLQRVLCYRRGDIGELEAVLALTVESLEAETQDSNRSQKLPRPAHVPIVSISLCNFLQFHLFVVLAFPKISLQTLSGVHINLMGSSLRHLSVDLLLVWTHESEPQQWLMSREKHHKRTESVIFRLCLFYKKLFNMKMDAFRFYTLCTCYCK